MIEVFVDKFALGLLILNAVILIVLMALQTDKAEQGGVMGIGASGGRQAGSVDMMVGPERILKPATKWSAIGLLFSAMLASMPAEKVGMFFIIFLAVYLVIMLFGDRVWRTLLGLNN